MKTKSFVVTMDTLFASFITFILSFVFISFFARMPYSLIISIIVTLLTFLFLYRHFSKKYKNKMLKKSELENVNNLINHLCLLKKAEINRLFERALKELNSNVTKKNGGLYLPDKNELCFFEFSFDGLTKTAIVKGYNSITKNDVALIYSAEVSKDVYEFSKRFKDKVKIIDKVDTYKLLEEANCLPKIDPPPKTKRKIKEIAMEFFTKKRAKSFFVFGSTFLFFSFFVTFKVYYIVMGCIFLTLSMCCLFLKPTSP